MIRARGTGEMVATATAGRTARAGEAGRSQGFHLMAKPVGPRCNLRCTYCFYREKEGLFEEHDRRTMSDEVLDAYIRQYLECQPGRAAVFDWQGGEPALAGIAFFERALALQRKHGRGRQIQNTFQTNGTLIDEEWCAFLAKHHFLVGLSIDGPAAVHDACRVDQGGHPTLLRVLRALESMQRHGVEVNVLATVNSASAAHPLDVYDFFKQHGVKFVQFIPIVEREPNPEATRLRLPLATPPTLSTREPVTAVTPWSVRSEEYGNFLIRIYDEWIQHDVGSMFVMNFEWTLAAFVGAGPGVCYLAPRCGRNLILEHDGGIYSCDHFMYPTYRVGNILDGDLRDLVESPGQRAFGASKETALPRQCRQCDLLATCRGGCPKHRFATSRDGEPGLNDLCAGFRMFYRHVTPSMKRMAALVHQGLPAAHIMEWRQKI